MGTTDTDLTALESCELLEGLAAQDRRTILGWGERRPIAAGEVLMTEGETGHEFAFLLEGRLKITRGGRPLSEVGIGAMIGEMCLFNEETRTGTVIAAEDGALLTISADSFAQRVLTQEPAALLLMERLGRLMVSRLQSSDAALLAEVGQSDPELAERVRLFATMKRRMLSDWALKYHSLGRAGKLAVVPTKPVGTAADLSVAYSPGVAEPCLAIKAEPESVYRYTAKANLVGVVTNGTAVLGLGDIGPEAAKPVMEGKAVLFKRFGDLDAFDIEVAETDPQRFVEIVASLAPTFGGINLEDIKAPECFEIEPALQARVDIPIFHDDQHGTAIIAGAGLLNALEHSGRDIAETRVVFAGAGAAGFASARYFISLGVRRENLILTDIGGVVYRGRGDGNYLDELAADTDRRTLAEAMEGADAFVGVSAGGIVSETMLKSMAPNPIVFALANPVPEIDPNVARQARDDLYMATGRSDYPNQINNVIAFPFIFRGALDVRARAINEEMKHAATRAIAGLAREETLGDDAFGRDHLIPKPFDPLLKSRVATAVAEAAMETGVAREPVDIGAYRRRLEA